MFQLDDYVSVNSLDQAYDLLMKDSNNTILGGLLWMKMGKKHYHTGIDLSNLGLDRIRETDRTIEIGSMTSLRQMETDGLLENWFGLLFRQAFQYIVGVQFRNCATLGGSIYPRFGFSDVLTTLLLLDARIELFQSGVIPLEQFLSGSRPKDVLVRVIIEKKKWQTQYQCQRHSATDFPVVSVAVGRSGESWHICSGARPGRAKRALKTEQLFSAVPDENEINHAGDKLVEELSFGTDNRAAGAYRQMLASVYFKRGVQHICSLNAG